MDYARLNELWVHQQEMRQTWELSLQVKTGELRQEVEILLNVPSLHWKDRSEAQICLYVDLKDFSSPEKRNVPQASCRSMSDNSELPFGIVLNMGHERTYPKHAFCIAVAVRFVEKEAQFNFWNTRTTSVEGSMKWESNISEFARATIIKLADFFRHDPYSGPNEKVFGFIQEGNQV